MADTPDLLGVQALLDKYRALLALRTEPALAVEVPKAELRAVAQRFPGALRELDRRPLSELHGRLAVLHAVLDGAAPCPSWVSVQLEYHGFMRAALRLRPVLRRCSGPLLEGLRQYRPQLGEPAAAALHAEWLARIAYPEGGRLNSVAYAFVGERYSLTPVQVEHLVFF